MTTSTSTPVGIEAAIAEIKRRQFAVAEARLAQKMQPARIAPLGGMVQVAAAPTAVQFYERSYN